VVDPQNKNHRLTVCRGAVLTDCSSSMMGFYWLMCFANLEQWAEESELHVMHLPGGFALASLGMGSIRQCALGRWSLSKKVTSRVRTWSSASTSIGLTHQFSHLMILISPVRISSSGKCKSFWLLDMMWLTPVSLAITGWLCCRMQLESSAVSRADWTARVTVALWDSLFSPRLKSERELD